MMMQPMEPDRRVNRFPPILYIWSDGHVAIIPPRLPSAFTTSPSNGLSGDLLIMLCLTWA